MKSSQSPVKLALRYSKRRAAVRLGSQKITKALEIALQEACLYGKTIQSQWVTVGMSHNILPNTLCMRVKRHEA